MHGIDSQMTNYYFLICTSSWARKGKYSALNFMQAFKWIIIFVQKLCDEAFELRNWKLWGMYVPGCMCLLEGRRNMVLYNLEIWSLVISLFSNRVTDSQLS